MFRNYKTTTITLFAFAGFLCLSMLMSSNNNAIADSPAMSYETQPVASVNGEIITGAKLNDILVRAWGYEAINHLIGNSLVMQAAAKEGLQISPQDIVAEEQLTLNAMLPEVKGVSRESMLAELLRTRHIPKHIWDVTMKRNAMLRKLALKRIYITDEMLTDAFNNRYGLKVQVRHIQCNSILDAQKIYKMLENGGDFVDLATKYSINSDSADRGGLIDPFSRDDKSIPKIIRETAFNLADGDVSEIIQADRFYHLLRRESTLPPETDVKFDEVRQQLRADLTDELVRMLQPRIIQELHDNSNIVLIDPILKQQAHINEAIGTISQ